jgi:hypothetical protein
MLLKSCWSLSVWNQIGPGSRSVLLPQSLLFSLNSGWGGIS